MNWLQLMSGSWVDAHDAPAFSPSRSKTSAAPLQGPRTFCGPFQASPGVINPCGRYDNSVYGWASIHQLVEDVRTLPLFCQYPFSELT